MRRFTYEYGDALDGSKSCEDWEFVYMNGSEAVYRRRVYQDAPQDCQPVEAPTQLATVLKELREKVVKYISACKGPYSDIRIETYNKVLELINSIKIPEPELPEYKVEVYEGHNVSSEFPTGYEPFHAMEHRDGTIFVYHRIGKAKESEK